METHGAVLGIPVPLKTINDCSAIPSHSSDKVKVTVHSPSSVGVPQNQSFTLSRRNHEGCPDIE